MSFQGAYNALYQTFTLMLYYIWRGQKEKKDKGWLKTAKKLREIEQEPVRFTGKEIFHIPASLYPKDFFLVLESQRCTFF